MKRWGSMLALVAGLSLVGFISPPEREWELRALHFCQVATLFAFPQFFLAAALAWTDHAEAVDARLTQIESSLERIANSKSTDSSSGLF